MVDLTDGIHTLGLYANDTAGNMGASEEVFFAVDTTPPLIENVHQNPPKNNVMPEDIVTVYANVTDILSGVDSVKLTYFINNSTIGMEIPMTFNSTTGLYEFGIFRQSAGTFVKYQIQATDNVGNTVFDDNAGQYYVYSVIPEFPVHLILLLLFTGTILGAIIYKRKRFT